MNSQDRGLLVGMVLGDGHLNVRTRLKSGKYRYESSELVIVHSVTQKAYAEYKNALVNRVFGGRCQVKPRSATLSNGKTYNLCGFCKSARYFRILKRMMYNGRNKMITANVLGMLTIPGLAIWYMDDGHARVNINKAGYVSSAATEIATCCSESEALVVCKWFLDMHSIVFKPYPTKGRFSVRCNTADSHKFARLVEPFIIPSMRYKLAHVADLDLHERKAPIGICPVCHDVVFDMRRKGLCDTCYTRQYRR